MILKMSFILFVLFVSNVTIQSANCYKVVRIANTTAEQTVAVLNSPMPQFVAPASFRIGATATNKPIISIMAAINYGGSSSPAGPVCSKAMELALDRVKLLPNFLKNYELVLELIDDQCDNAAAIEQVEAKLERTTNEDTPNRIPLLIVPQCPSIAELVTAEMIKHYNFIGVASSQNSVKFAIDRERFGSFFALAQRPDLPYEAMADFMVAMGWYKVAIFSEIFAYFDESEQYIIPIFESKNITLLWMGKVMYQSQDSDEMKEAFSDMAKRKPRVILQNTNSPASLSCWLHRYGMFGPSYVILSTDWSYFDPWTIQIPEYVSSWCSRSMLAQVLPSWIFFGGLSLRNVFDPTFADSTGLSIPMFQSKLKEKVKDAEKSDAWKLWPQLCYDQTLFAAHVLNATDTFLRESRNESLLDWTTDSVNFKQNGRGAVDLLKRGVFTASVSGLMGDYRFDSKTTINSRGFSPMIFLHDLPKEGSSTEFDHLVIAYYKSNEAPGKRIIMINSTNRKSHWLTIDGQPPRDSVRTIFSELPPTSEATYAALLATGSLGNLICLVMGLVALTCGVPISRTEWITLLGCLVMLSHVYALPGFSGSEINRNCSAIGFLLVIGFSLSISAVSIRLLGSRHVLLGDYNSAEGAAGMGFYFNKFAVAFCIYWMAQNAALFAAFVNVAPIVTGKELLPPTNSPIDPSVAYQLFRVHCQLSPGVFVDSSSQAILGVMALLHLGIILQTVFTAYEVGSARQVVVQKDTKALCIAVYCQVTVIVACVLIAVLFSGAFQSVQIVISVVALVFAFVNLLQLTYAKLLRQQVENEREPAGLWSVQMNSTFSVFRQQKAPVIGPTTANEP